MDLDFAIEIFCETGFGEIVVCRSQTAGDDHHIGTRFSFRKDLKNRLLLVADCSAPDYLDTDLIQFSADVVGVGIHGLTVQQLVADGHDLSFDEVHKMVWIKCSSI